VPEFVAVEDVLGGTKKRSVIFRGKYGREMDLAQDQIRNATITEKLIISTDAEWR